MSLNNRRIQLPSENEPQLGTFVNGRVVGGDSSAIVIQGGRRYKTVHIRNGSPDGHHVGYLKNKAGEYIYELELADPEVSSKIDWIEPTWVGDRDWLERASEELDIAIWDLREAFNNGALESLDKKRWVEIEGIDAVPPLWTQERTHARMLEGKMPAPIIIMQKDKPPFLVSGSTRLRVCREQGYIPHVYTIYI